jgi:hypothetical protein
VSADPETGEWTWSDDGAWRGGFWVGPLEPAARATGRRRIDAMPATVQLPRFAGHPDRYIADPTTTRRSPTRTHPPGDSGVQRLRLAENAREGITLQPHVPPSEPV